MGERSFMLDRFRVEAQESNNDEIVLVAEEGDVRVTAKVPCDLLDRVAGSPLPTFRDRLEFSVRNLTELAAIVQRKFTAGEFRSYRGLDGWDRWIVLDRGDIGKLRMR
jgi:hypothetical protein